MKVKAKIVQIGILALCVQSSAMAVTTAEVILDVFVSYGTLAKDFLVNNSEMLFVLAGGKLRSSIPATQVELSFGALKDGAASVVGGASSLWGMLQLKDKQILAGGATLTAIGAYIAYRVQANSEQIEEVYQEVVSNGEKIDEVQQTLNATRNEIAQGFAQTETSITLAKEDLQKRIESLRIFLHAKLQQQNKVTLLQHQTILQQLQQVKSQLTLISEEKDEQYNGLLAQFSALEKKFMQQMDENFASSEKRTQLYVEQKFDKIEQNQLQMMKLLTYRDASSSGSSCQGRALNYVSSK